jgi:catechol 2,3-dioxygenase-like lactoylglutathione lyase family enzyme
MSRRLCEIAIVSSDVAATARFYERVLGRVAAEGGHPTFYLDGIVLRILDAGASPTGTPTRDHIAICVDDVDEAAGEFDDALDLEARDYYWGRSAYLRDPDGRVVELFRDSQLSGHPADTVPPG